MEIKKINDPLVFPNFGEYFLELPFDGYDELGDLYSIEDEGKLYVITKKGNAHVIVENDNGIFRDYSGIINESGELINFTDQFCEYNFKFESDFRQIVRGQLSTADVDTFIYSIDDEGKACLEYRQFINDIFSGLTFRYDVSTHSHNVETALAYTIYHLPFQLELHKSVGNLFPREKIYFYFADYDDPDKYRRAYIVRDSKYHLASWFSYDGKTLIKYICDDLKFNETIDDGMRELMTESNPIINKTKSLINNCESFIKGQK